MNRFFYFLLGAILIIGILGFFAIPVSSTIPPTPAFKIINNTNGNVTASNYADFIEFKEGSGMTIIPNYNTNEITFSSSGGSVPHEKYCYPNALSNFNSTTLDFDCVTIGFTDQTSATNLGNGSQVYESEIGDQLRFRTLGQGSGITLSQNATVITISATGGSGEANTMSSPTHANSLVLTKSGVDLPIKGIACSGSVTCSTNSTDITLSLTALSDMNTAQIVSAGGTSLFKSRNNATENSIKGLTTTKGITLTSNTNDIDISTNFKALSKTCSGTDKISSYDNSTGVFTCSTDQTGGTSREETVANWETDRTWTNIGTAYNDVYTVANSNGDGIRIDTAGKTTVTLNIMWTKVGAGCHGLLYAAS